MGLRLVTPPAAEPVSLAEAKLHLRVDGADEDSLITALIAAARGHAEDFLNRALLTQEWELVLDRSPAGALEIPKPPLQELGSITTVGLDGQPTVVPAANYLVDAASQPGRLTPAPGYAWPTHRGFASFIVRFRAGWADANALPAQIKQGVLLTIGHLYANREAQEAPPEALNLWRSYRIRPGV